MNEYERSGLSLKRLAQELNVNYGRVSKYFKWWCREHHVEPDEFLRRAGPYKNTYNLPVGFVKEFRAYIRKEKHIVLVGTKDGEPVRITE